MSGAASAAAAAADTSGDDEPHEEGEGTEPAREGRTRYRRRRVTNAALDAQIERLKKERVEARKARQGIVRDLKNATRRRSRLLRRASVLSEKDLFDIMAMRNIQSNADSSTAAPRPEAEQAPNGARTEDGAQMEEEGDSKEDRKRTLMKNIS